MELAIRVIDIICYFVVLVGGFYAAFYTPTTAVQTLNGSEWLIGWWAGFLFVGGLMGLVGRITTIWIIEPAADFAAFIGVMMYFVVLGTTALSSVTATVAACLVFVAGLGVARRYLELQLFGTDPARSDFRSKMVDALERRIPNVPPRG